MNLNNTSNTIRFGTCSKDCYGSCVFKGIWDDFALENKLIKVIPDKKHPFTNGFFCPKFKQRQHLLCHQDRLINPLIRNGPKSVNDFKNISIEKAIGIISEKIEKNVKDKASRKILAAFYSGNSGLISRYAPLRFFGQIGATVTSGGICNEGGCVGLSKLFGTYSTTNPFQLNNEETHLIVIWGCNLSESNIHAYYLVKRASKRGATVIVVDSRRTHIAERAHKFLHIYPSTEHLLVKLILNEIITNQAYDDDFLKENVDYYESIINEVDNINKEKLLSQIGVNYQSFQDFVDLLVKFKHHTIFNIGYGIQKDFFGGRIVKTIALIQILLGNIGKPGTGIIYSQSDFLKLILRPIQDYIIQMKNQCNLKEIPLITLGDELLSREYNLLFIYNLNPVSSLPNQNQLRKALSNEDLYVVVLDMFLNATTKYADIVIPAKFDLESNDFISSYYIPSLSINIGGPCPFEYCMSNFEFFQKLAINMGLKNHQFFQETEEEIFNYCLNKLPSNIRNELEQNGYYLHFDKEFVPFENLEFPTQNGHIITRGPHFDFGEKVLNQRLASKENEFLLITPSHRKFLHSQLKQIQPKYIKDFDKVFLLMDDLNKLNLKVGDRVSVSNNYGSGIYTLEDLPSLKPGVALIYSGLSSSLEGNTNANTFTPNRPEELGFSGAYNSAIVKISKIDNNF